MPLEVPVHCTQHSKKVVTGAKYWCESPRQGSMWPHEVITQNGNLCMKRGWGLLQSSCPSRWPGQMYLLSLYIFEQEITHKLSSDLWVHWAQVGNKEQSWFGGNRQQWGQIGGIHSLLRKKADYSVLSAEQENTSLVVKDCVCVLIFFFFW